MSEALLVADSGPLIALARLGLLSLPAQLFREALVTATVWDEVSREPHAAELLALNAAVQAGHLRVISDPTGVVLQVTEPRIDAGERSAIVLALSVGAVVLMDEKRGQPVAEALGLHVLGTLGLLVSARDAGIVDRVRPLAEALRQGGYHRPGRWSNTRSRPSASSLHLAQRPAAPLKPIPVKDRLSVVFIERGEIDVLDGAFVVIARRGMRRVPVVCSPRTWG